MVMCNIYFTFLMDYKLSDIRHNYFSYSSPAYLSDFPTVYTPSVKPRSFADTRILRIPLVKTKTFGRIFFSYSEAVKFSPFCHPLHVILLCLQNCVKNEDDGLNNYTGMLIGLIVN